MQKLIGVFLALLMGCGFAITTLMMELAYPRTLLPKLPSFYEDKQLKQTFVYLKRRLLGEKNDKMLFEKLTLEELCDLFTSDG